MQGLVAGAGQAGITFVDLGVGVSLAKVEVSATATHISDMCYPGCYYAPRRRLHESVYPRPASGNPGARPPPAGFPAWLRNRARVFRPHLRCEGQKAWTRRADAGCAPRPFRRRAGLGLGPDRKIG